MLIPNTPVTSALLIAQYAQDLAYVTEQTRASTVAGFTAQLDTAARLFTEAGIHNIDGCHIAARCLRDADRATGKAKKQFLRQAADHLRDVRDMAAEYQWR
ncbi:hypothetical protein [Streptomyces sp. NPDC058861]|uniref:hypothetical protein n=1 Tax=Streptomyces sp. NPDC058861 TaxID=3346653 RepID=UPI00367E8AC1